MVISNVFDKLGMPFVSESRFVCKKINLLANFGSKEFLDKLGYNVSSFTENSFGGGNLAKRASLLSAGYSASLHSLTLNISALS